MTQPPSSPEPPPITGPAPEPTPPEQRAPDQSASELRAPEYAAPDYLVPEYDVSSPGTAGSAGAPTYGPGYPPPTYGPGYPPPALGPAGQPLASFSDRLLALLVDSAVGLGIGLVLGVPAVIIFMIWVMPGMFEVQPDGTIAEPDFLGDFLLPFLLLELGLLIVGFAISYVYYVEMMFRSGQTLGKKMMKIRIVPLDPFTTLNRAAAAKRFLVQNVAAAFIPGLSYVDGLWQLWDKPYQQCLHDKFARTVVVKVPG